MSLTQLLNLTAQIEGIEWMVLLGIVMFLFFFGPTKIPELARGVGRAWGEFKVALKEGQKEGADATRKI